MPVNDIQRKRLSDCQITVDAQVIATYPDGYVSLQFAPPRQCGACGGTCLWKRLQAARIDRLPAPERLDPGARVSVALAGSRVLVGSLLLYGLPLVAILAGAAAGAMATGSDWGTLVGAMLGIGLVLIGFRRYRQRCEQLLLSGLVMTPKP